MASNEAIKLALLTAQESLNTWACIFAPDECRARDVKVANIRIEHYGTLGYIAVVNSIISDGLAALADQPSDKAEQEPSNIDHLRNQMQFGADMVKKYSDVCSSFKQECDDVDVILKAIGIDPEKARSEGGSLKLGYIKSCITDASTNTASKESAQVALSERDAFEAWVKYASDFMPFRHPKFPDEYHDDVVKEMWDAWQARSQVQRVPEGWKLLKDSMQEERSFNEDLEGEKGLYWNTCFNCLRVFMSYKGRMFCKVCLAAAPSPAQAQEGE